MPIVFSLIPTIVGAALLVSLEGPQHKGALLFGEPAIIFIEITQSSHVETHRELHHRNFRKLPRHYLRVEREQHQRSHKESYHKCYDFSSILSWKHNRNGDILA